MPVYYVTVSMIDLPVLDKVVITLSTDYYLLIRGISLLAK